MPNRPTDILAAQRAQREAHYDAGIAQWHERHPDDDTTHLTRAAVANCVLCDDDGYRPTGPVCDHVDRADIAKRGIARVRAALDATKGATQ